MSRAAGSAPPIAPSSFAAASRTAAFSACDRRRAESVNLGSATDSATRRPASAARSECVSRKVASGAAMMLPMRSNAFWTANRACVAGSASSSNIAATTSLDACDAAHSAACARTAGCGSASRLCTKGSATSSCDKTRAPRRRRVHRPCRQRARARSITPTCCATKRSRSLPVPLRLREISRNATLCTSCGMLLSSSTSSTLTRPRLTRRASASRAVFDRRSIRLAVTRSQSPCRK